MDLRAWRNDARTRLVAARAAIPPEAHQAASAAILDSLDSVLKPLSPRTVTAYWPFKGEVDLRESMHRLRAIGWRTALPVVAGPGLPLMFRLWTSGSEMDPGVYKIPVPRDGELVEPDVVITPLVGFDRRNYRLGYGAGYFDITLAAMKRPPLSIGVGFEAGRLNTIHPLATDIPMDLIITEAGIQRQQPDV